MNLRQKLKKAKRELEFYKNFMPTSNNTLIVHPEHIRCEKTKHGELLATIVAVSLVCLVSVILLPVVVVLKLVCHILGIKL